MKKFAKRISTLTSEQYYVTQESGTEHPFKNIYWNFFEKGLYLDIVSDAVLFSSENKFQSSCGWPSFFDSCNPDEIVRVDDYSLGTHRVEVRSKTADSHLGHVFDDGPSPTYTRFCINSAAIRFISSDEIKKQNLTDLLSFFKEE